MTSSHLCPQLTCVVALCLCLASGAAAVAEPPDSTQNPADKKEAAAKRTRTKSAESVAQPEPLQKVGSGRERLPQQDPDAERCDYPAVLAPKGTATRRNAENTFVFNHERLKADGDSPYVLKADDGGYFQVLFKCTAPQFFNYTITGDPAAQPDSADATTLPESVRVRVHLTTRGVTMRHDSRFLRYHVTAKLREGVRQPSGQRGRAGAPVITGPPDLPSPPMERLGSAKAAPDADEVELFSVAFDVWVITKPEWKLGVIGGVAASSLVDSRYFIKTDNDAHKTFQQDTQDRVHTDVMALANAYYTETYKRFVNVGLAFGIGTSGTAPRFFLGPSLVLGKFFVFSPGVAVGSVMRAPVGQAVGTAPVNGDNTLNTLSSRMMARPYLGIGFTWIDRTDQFAAALSSAASAAGTVGSCVTSVTPEAIALDEDGKSASPIVVKAGADCLWAATLQRGGNGIDVKDGAQKGDGTVTVTGPRAGKALLSDVLNVIGPLGSIAKPVQVTQAPKSCVTSVSETAGGTAITSLTFDSTTTPRTIQVKTEDGCQWTATVAAAAQPFILDPSTSTTGSGALKITPPAATADDLPASLEIVGPPGAAAKTIALKQPKKSADE